MKKIITILIIGVIFSSLFITTAIAANDIPQMCSNPNKNSIGTTLSGLSLSCDCTLTDLGQKGASSTIRFTAATTNKIDYDIACSINQGVSGDRMYFSCGKTPGSLIIYHNQGTASFNIVVTANSDPEPDSVESITVMVTITSGGYSAQASMTISLSKDGIKSSSGTGTLTEMIHSTIERQIDPINLALE